MTPETIMSMGNQAIQVSLALGAPLLLVALVVGLVISIFQAATQINESTLSFIPKLVGIFVALVVAGPWMLSVMLDYMRQIFTGIPGMIG
jgi:flagellar biosynthetic protein FliQ